ncbi:MAG: class I SAM-dependent methyltransferase [Candidatus Binatia bacterium]
MSESTSFIYDEAYFDGPLVAWHKLSLPTFAAFLREVSAKARPRRILDLGCGAGTYGQILRHMGDIVVGCESAPEAVKRAQTTGWYEQVLYLDLETVIAPQLAGPYDLVFCTEVIEHLADEQRACRLMAEVIAPGGRLVLTTTTYHIYLFYYLLCAVPRQKGAYRNFFRGCWNDAAADRFVQTLWALTGGHYHGFRARRLLLCLTKNGFLIERWNYTNVQPVFPLAPLEESRFHRGLWRMLAPVLKSVGLFINESCRRTNCYGANILVAARKA